MSINYKDYPNSRQIIANKNKSTYTIFPRSSDKTYIETDTLLGFEKHIISLKPHSLYKDGDKNRFALKPMGIEGSFYIIYFDENSGYFVIGSIYKKWN